MNVERLSDPQDARASDYRQLTDVGLRKKVEPQQGLFMAESHQVIARAITAGFPVRSVLTTPRWLDAVRELDLPTDTPVLVGDESLVNEITGYRVHRGSLAAMSRVPLPTVADVIAGAQRIAVFENLVDHTNLGAGFRSAAALGVGAVLVTPECADPLYRRSVRVSMGAVFDLPWTRLSSWPGDVDLLKSLGYTVVAVTPGESTMSLDEFDARAHPHLALILGTEGAGITEEVQALSDYRLRIPMSGAVDSLNVAAAAAVAFYATRR